MHLPNSYIVLKARQAVSRYDDYEPVGESSRYESGKERKNT